MSKKVVKDIMSKKVISIDETASIKDAVGMMEKNDVASLLVNCAEDRPFGMITRGDIMYELIVNEGDPSAPVSKIMAAPLVLATPNLRVKDAAMLMARYKIRRLPVLQKGSIVGIVSVSDVFKYLTNSLKGK